MCTRQCCTNAQRHGRPLHALITDFGSEPHDPDSELEEDTTEANPDPNEQEETSQDADTNPPSFDSVPQDDLEDELEPWVD